MDSISNSNDKANTIADEGRPFKKAKSCDETATSTIVTDGDNSESDADEDEDVPALFVAVTVNV